MNTIAPQLSRKVLPVLLTGVASFCFAQNSMAEDDWFPLFNGKNLDGWTVKIAKHPLGENFQKTFRAEDGMIKVSYDDYDTFDMQFGHLYTNQIYENYIVRLEYRFEGEVMEDAPSWTAFNSGLMLHSQSPLSLGFEQSFPVSLEGQFLASGTSAGTQTANVCTPGTHISVNGAPTHAHIIDSGSTLFGPETWVQFEAEVHSDREIIYRINGEEVLRYQHPILDSEDPDANRLIKSGASLRVQSGHIALQAEGHPVWFRNIEIKPLED